MEWRKVLQIPHVELVSKTVSKIFGSMNIEIEPSQILDCYRLGKYNPDLS